MIVEEYEFMGYKVEIHEHPIYHDFEYVIKKDNEVKFTNRQFYKDVESLHDAVKKDIKSVINE